MVRRCGRSWTGLFVALAAACGDVQSLPCEEPDDASPELDRVSLMVRDTEISAELALDQAARDSAWAGRRCDLDAVLWVPERVGPAAVTLCGLEVAVDLAYVRDGEVVAVDLEVPPCREPCDACPAHGDDGPAVDAVLWFPAGRVDVVEGDSVTGLDAVALPVE